MTEYERQITLAAWRWVCRESYGNEVSTEVMEDSAREIAGYFDLPYMSVLEDLLKEHERLQIAHSENKRNIRIRGDFLDHQRLMQRDAPPELFERYRGYVRGVADDESPKSFREWLEN